MRRKAWWAAGTVAAVSLAGLVTAGIAATSSAGEDDREIKNKDGKRGKRVVRIVSPGFGGKGAFLGVHTVEETDGDDGGARVETVVEGSPADEAGIQEGDVIVAFDGHTVRGPVALTEYIHETEPKEKVTVTVLRDGRRKTLDVEMGQRARGLLIPGQVETIEVPLDFRMNVPVDTSMRIDQTIDVAMTVPIDVVLTERELDLTKLEIPIDTELYIDDVIPLELEIPIDTEVETGKERLVVAQERHHLEARGD